MARDYYDETEKAARDAAAKQKQADALATAELNKQPVYQPTLYHQPSAEDYAMQALAAKQPQTQVQSATQSKDTPSQMPSQTQAVAQSKDNTSQTPQPQSQQAPGEVIPSTLKAQSDWNAVGKYMYLPNHPKATNGYVQISKGDVIWARQKLNLPTEQPEATAPTAQTASQVTTTATQPKDAVDKQAVGVPLDQRGELLKQYQKAMRNAKKLKAQYTSKAKQYFRDIEQIKADAEGNKEYRMNEARTRWYDEKRSLNEEYQKAMQVASQYYEQLRK